MSIKFLRIINAASFYIIWWGSIFSIKYNLYLIPILITVLISYLHFTFFSKNKHEIIFIIYCLLISIIYESIYLNVGFIEYTGYVFDNIFFPPLWTMCMWISLGITINHSMDLLKNKWVVIGLSGALFGPLGYLSLMKLDLLIFNYSLSKTLFILSAMCSSSLLTLFYLNKKIQEKYGG